MVGDSPGSLENNVYSPGCDKVTKVQLYMSTSCQPSNRVIRAFSNNKKPFYFLIWRLKPPNQKMKMAFQSEKGLISSWVKSVLLTRPPGNNHLEMKNIEMYHRRPLNLKLNRICTVCSCLGTLTHYVTWTSKPNLSYHSENLKNRRKVEIYKRLIFQVK